MTYAESGLFWSQCFLPSLVIRKAQAGAGKSSLGLLCIKADFQSSHEAPRSSLRELADVLRVFCRSQGIVQNFELFFTRCERSQ